MPMLTGHEQLKLRDAIYNALINYFREGSKLSETKTVESCRMASEAALIKVEKFIEEREKPDYKG
jgi:hypothetical protein